MDHPGRVTWFHKGKPSSFSQEGPLLGANLGALANMTTVNRRNLGFMAFHDSGVLRISDPDKYLSATYLSFERINGLHA
uniref:Dirigent protein n=1 Tax=Angiostrongylus cantonensis TaxID=6313 RepID=A0A0K0DH72_ANGCA